MLAYRRLKALGKPSPKRELLGVIVEVGLEGGLDVMASYEDGRARYINQSGSMIVWENPDDARVSALIKTGFDAGRKALPEITRWESPRPQHPQNGNARITFLVSGDFYIGHGPTDQFFADDLAKPVADAALQLMTYLMAASEKK